MKPEEQKPEERKKPEEAKKGRPDMRPTTEEEMEVLVRILSTDIPGNKRLLAGLTRIKGVSWSFSNAVCNALKMDKNKRIFIEWSKSNNILTVNSFDTTRN